MKTRPLLLLSLLLLTPLAGLHGQGRPPAPGQGGGPGPGDIHRSLNALEAELVAILDRKEQIINASEQRNNELHQLSLDRAKAEAKDRDRLASRIEVLNNFPGSISPASASGWRSTVSCVSTAMSPGVARGAAAPPRSAPSTW
jgi:hypothetical protein